MSTGRSKSDVSARTFAPFESSAFNISLWLLRAAMCSGVSDVKGDGAFTSSEWDASNVSTCCTSFFTMNASSASNCLSLSVIPDDSAAALNAVHAHV